MLNFAKSHRARDGEILQIRAGILSRRDKLVCAMFFLFSSPTALTMGKF
jgi:hypothetical protein